MKDLIRILGIAGSLRTGSYNVSALRAAAEMLRPDCEIDIYDLVGIPLFNQDHEKEPPPAVIELKRRIRQADAILMATPEYNYSIPGVLKNAIDWASRPHGDNAWSGKPAAILGASPGGIGTARAQYHLRQVFVYLNVFPINKPEVMITDAPNRFDAESRLIHEPTRQLVRELVVNLVAWAKRLRTEE